MASIQRAAAQSVSLGWFGGTDRPYANSATREAKYAYLFTSHWIVSYLLVVAASNIFSFVLVLSRPDFYTKSAIEYAYYNSTVYADFSWSFPLHWLEPWPDYDNGKIGWYRQGIKEVRENRHIIETFATDQVPAILLAAAIANQGNCLYRPFGWDGVEEVQSWLGRRFDWQLPQWSAAKRSWDEAFEQPSIGIGQIVPSEARSLGFAGRDADLFDDMVSVSLIRAKLAASYEIAGQPNLSQTDLFVLAAISNNSGVGVLHAFREYDGDMSSFLANNKYAKHQLAKMMSYVDHLQQYEEWTLPDWVNREYIWWLIQRPTGAP